MPSFLSELQPSFDDPDRICRSACDDARDGCSREMDVGVFLSVVEIIGNHLLSIPVGEEVDRTCGNDANQCRTETLEQCARRLVAVDIAIKRRRIGWYTCISPL